jgi:RNA polymerase sigma-70 factor (ECF subfamily)
MGTPRTDLPWLQPFPDTLLGAGAAGDVAGDPASIVASRGTVRLALIAALQHLPPRQRAVLILRDVLSWRATEVATLLGTTTAAVNSALQRARAQLDRVAPTEDRVAEPSAAEQRALLDRYMTAWTTGDITTLVTTLRDDAVLEMPPTTAWFAGREAVVRFLAHKVAAYPGRWRAVPAAANGHPAMAAYRRGEDGRLAAHSIQVFTVTASGIARIVAFVDTALFATFGLPVVLPEATSGATEEAAVTRPVVEAGPTDGR